jgi:hypothetical protein
MMRSMFGRSGKRLAWTGGALAIGLGVSTPAGAVIPYDAQITPGELRGIAHAPGDPWLYGYWEYLPTNIEYADTLLPLLVFLPGVGEYDDVSSCPGGTDLCTPADCGNDGLCRNLTWGPQQLMAAGTWDDVTRPFIMVSPQHPVPPFATTGWDVDMLDDYLQFIVDNYPVDPRRLYLIGMSQGGRAVLQYTQAYPRRFAAVAPSPGGVVDVDASCYFQDTALWVFHGENDSNGTLGAGVFNPCNMVGVAYQYENPELYVGSAQCVSIAGEPRPPGRLTMFENTAHSSWIPTVDPIGAGFARGEWLGDQGCGIPATFRQYDPALDADGVYSWFLSLDRPRVLAPADVLVDVPDVSLPAVITDDDAVTISWTQTGGPPATLGGADTDTLEVTGMQESQQYTFQVYVLDADEQWDLDEVVVTTDVFAVAGTGSTGDPGTSSSDGGTTGTSSSDGGGTTGTSSSGGGASTGTDTGLGDGSSGTGTGPGTGTGAGTGTGMGGDTGPATDGGAASTAADGTAGDGTAGDSHGGTAGHATTTGAATDSDTDGAAAEPDGSSGCGCHSGRPASGHAWAWAWLLLGFARRPRRRRGSSDAAVR